PKETNKTLVIFFLTIRFTGTKEKKKERRPNTPFLFSLYIERPKEEKKKRWEREAKSKKAIHTKLPLRLV
ncbi:hypothetical protein RYX45_25725, partial [Alkalihalophilus pseudofirmus]